MKTSELSIGKAEETSFPLTGATPHPSGTAVLRFRDIGDKVKNVPLGRFAVMPYRAYIAGSYYVPKIKQIFRWLIRSREHTNHSYHLTDLNLKYLANTLSVATGASVQTIEAYLHEPLQDSALAEFVSRTSRLRDSQTVDAECRLGRRLGWYALVRHLRPRLIVETGVDKGLGSVLLCSALMRNAKAGYEGEYLGTDINPRAGLLLRPPYSHFGSISYGDSIESLEKIQKPIDIFINDSDHSAEYEYREYLTIADKLSPTAVVLGDNSHLTDALLRFSRERDREFVFFKEEPLDHWYPGGGIGISFKRKPSTITF
jgi:predicted O-methyltransferase YrrM